MSKYSKEYYDERYRNQVAGISADLRRAYLYKARLRMLKRLNITGKVVLEVGCGSGPMTKYLVNEYSEVNAIDISSEAIKICKSHLKNNNLHIEIVCDQEMTS